MAAPAPCPAPARDTDASPELADILRLHGDEVVRDRSLAAVQLKAISDIIACRTAALGASVRACNRCGAQLILYNSCRNRHCPKCQSMAKERWLQARRAELLDVEYFHVVFTLPHALNPLAQGNPRLIYNLLFAAATETLTAFGGDPDHLGGRIGGTAILHTWGQNLSQHIHLHCLVPGGAISPDQRRWIAARPGYLFPVRALSCVFRAKFLEALQAAFDNRQIELGGSTAELAHPVVFDSFIHDLRRQHWVVYSKPPFAGPEAVLDYFGRYTHRVAISNHRILALERGKVRFSYKDYRRGGRSRTMQLPAAEFIRRFLLHILPSRFHRIRHFGFLANRIKKDQLALCRRLLGQLPAPERPAAPESPREIMLRVVEVDIQRCPFCRRGTLVAAASVPRAPPLEPWDTS